MSRHLPNVMSLCAGDMLDSISMITVAVARIAVLLFFKRVN